MIKRLRHAAKLRRIKTLIVSFPKTGRTWLRVMIGRALIEGYGLNESLLLDTYKATRRAGLPAARFSHGGPYFLLDDARYHEMSFDAGLYEQKRVLYIVRDVRDTLVSFYFQQAKRERVFRGDVHAFLRDECFGARKLVRFYTLWFQNRSVPEDFLCLRYEDMHRNPEEALAGVLAFLGATRCGPQTVSAAVSFASFENMKRMERGGNFDRKLMKPGNPDDAESYKVRKGKIGGYAEYLDEDDQQYITETIAELGDPACDWYLWSQDDRSRASNA